MTGADGTENLRERRKRLTREAIAAAAMRLFAEHGFDNVTVAQVAAAAKVAEKTVYNYFPRKSDLFFDEAGDILTELLFAVRNRGPGQAALDAVQSFLAGRAEWAAGRRPARPTRSFRQLIAGSPALQAGMRDMFARYESALAAVLAEETAAPPGSAEPFIAAVALVGLIRAPFEVPHGTGLPARPAMAGAVRLLRAGLGSYPAAADGQADAASAASTSGRLRP